MKIIEITIENYRGIKDLTKFEVKNFNCIVGKNDVGKSTILKAMNMFLNDIAPNSDDKNINAESNLISVTICFESQNLLIDIDGGIQTSLNEEGLIDERGHLYVRKQWDVSQKLLNHYFLLKEKNIAKMTLCF